MKIQSPTTLLVALFFVLSGTLCAQTLILDASNCNPANATACIQAAINDQNISRVILADVGQNWVSDRLTIGRDNFTFELENADVVLQAEPGALAQFESLLRILLATNVTVEGNGGTFLLDKSEYDASSQFRHGINLAGPTNVTVQNLTILRAPGDGILVGSAFVQDVNDADGDGDVTDFEPTAFCFDITIDNVICDGNNRQGISVTSVVGLTVTNSQFINTSGTEPESGVDFEPFRRYQPMQGIVFDNCTFSGNNGNGIQFGGVDLNAGSPISDILITNALVSGNGQNPNRSRAGVQLRNIYDPFNGADASGNPADRTSSTGTFTLRNSTVRDEPYSGLNVRQYASGIDVSIENVVFDNVANTPINQGAGPILVQPVDYGDEFNNDPCFGNVAFSNVRLIDDQTDRRQVTVTDFRGGPSGPQNVTGDICVEFVAPQANATIATFLDDQPCGNFTLAVSECLTTLPVTLTDFRVETNTDDCQHEITWTVAEASNVRSFTVETSQDGRNWTAVDSRAVNAQSALGGHSRFVRAGPDAAFRLRTDDIDGSFSYGPVVYAAGCKVTDGLEVWPNPARNVLYLAPVNYARTFRMMNVQGQTITTVSLPADRTKISLQQVPAGVYTLHCPESAATTRVVITK